MITNANHLYLSWYFLCICMRIFKYLLFGKKIADSTIGIETFTITKKLRENFSSIDAKYSLPPNTHIRAIKSVNNTEKDAESPKIAPNKGLQLSTFLCQQ